jgi:hypothetical protein
MKSANIYHILAVSGVTTFKQFIPAVFVASIEKKSFCASSLSFKFSSHYVYEEPHSELFYFL